MNLKQDCNEGGSQYGMREIPGETSVRDSWQRPGWPGKSAIVCMSCPAQTSYTAHSLADPSIGSLALHINGALFFTSSSSVVKMFLLCLEINQGLFSGRQSRVRSATAFTGGQRPENTVARLCLDHGTALQNKSSAEHN